MANGNAWYLRADGNYVARIDKDSERRIPVGWNKFAADIGMPMVSYIITDKDDAIVLMEDERIENVVILKISFDPAIAVVGGVYTVTVRAMFSDGVHTEKDDVELFFEIQN